MHSRKKGRSSSTKPAKKTAASWIPLKPKEIEMLIVKLAKEHMSASQIGLVMRDQYGVPDIKMVTGKTISQILEAKKLAPDIPEDLMALMRKAVLIRKHMDENKKDMPGKRGLQLTESKIFRLSKYYKKVGKIPADWKYDPQTLRLQVE
jgi:small subunit ribosomal protein S15